MRHPTGSMLPVNALLPATESKTNGQQTLIATPNNTNILCFPHRCDDVMAPLYVPSQDNPLAHDQAEKTVYGKAISGP